MELLLIRYWKKITSICLISGDICNCGKHSDTIGHPQSCYAYVLCEEIQGIIYPYGISCPSGECRNSITGMCSANCSKAVCDETVPSGNFFSMINSNNKNCKTTETLK